MVVDKEEKKKKGVREWVDVEKRGVYQRSYTYSRALCDSLFFVRKRERGREGWREERGLRLEM